MKFSHSVLILFIFICFPECIQLTEKGDFQNIVQVDEISENKAIGNAEFYENENTISDFGAKKYQDLVKTIDNYIQRYVSLFLITSNLREYKVKDLNEMILVDLELSLTGEDLSYLQNYSKSAKDSSYLKNLSKIDAIFSKIARLKERSFTENAFKSTKSFFSSFNYFSIVSNPNFYRFLSFLITILVTWIIHHYLFHKNFYVFLGLTINSMIFWESLNEYWKKLKETDLDIFVQSLKTGPEECNRRNLRWYNSLWSYFSEDPCLQYHKIINKSPVEEVSLIKCIIDTYSFYLIRTPLKIYGASVKDLTEEITALWPSPVRYFISLPFAPFFAIVLTFFIFILCRKRMRLSFFGAAVEIGDVQKITVNQKPTQASIEIQKTVRILRKLKPWTKSRFPKRLEGNMGKRKKIFLKSSRSESELPSQDEQQFTHSCDNLISNEIKHD